MSIKTDSFSEKLRAKSIDVAERKLLVTNFVGTAQEGDLSEPANCGGFGRVRHFRRVGAAGWPDNPLPIDPAANKLGLNREDVILAQVFQNASCNWRCWYCFVPFDLLNANRAHSSLLSASDLMDLYQAESAPPLVIDLSGGQPDLTPEWVPWMMRELSKRNLDRKVYLWSDDNLSNDYFWRYLTTEDIETVRTFRNYGKVCCFKGYDAASFAFNTAAEPELFERQLQLFGRYLSLGIDLYAYATFTSPSERDVASKMSVFVDRLQEITPNLPLRVVPLEIREFAPVMSRIKDEHRKAITVQWDAIAVWKAELEKRFSPELRRKSIYEIPL
jgi:uncharacterized Fe-S cluster-containing radical SAM superfamily protein